MSNICPVNFCGSGCETAGSAAFRSHHNCPTCNAEVNFRRDYHHGLVSNKVDKKKNSGLKWIIGLSVAIAAGIIGLGKGFDPLVKTLKDGKVKDIVKKAEPAAARCKEWCGSVQAKSIEYWDKIKDFLTKKHN